MNVLKEVDMHKKAHICRQFEGVVTGVTTLEKGNECSIFTNKIHGKTATK
jgi:hypothetical protein